MAGAGADEAIRQLLRAILEKGVCRAVLAPVRMPHGHGVAPALISEPDRLSDCVPFAPVMALSEATVAGSLTVGEGALPVAILLHPCQLRAFVELAKLRQAGRDNTLLISIDCSGVYDTTEYSRLVRSGYRDGELAAGLHTGSPRTAEGYELRAACQICEQPIPDVADLWIRLVGVPEGEIRVRGASRLIEQLGLETAETPAGTETASAMIAARSAERERMLAEYDGRVSDVAGLLGEFAACIHCLNCMTACPLCYCKECIFRTETFDHVPGDYARWAERKGAVRMPADTILFHLTRLNHMAVSCVGCGLCEAACPNDLPVSRLFRLVGRRVQALFDYLPGRDWDEQIPIATFREDELE